MSITTTEAPHFRRVMTETRGASPAKRPSASGHHAHGHLAGIRDGNGILFISDEGEVTPSGFLPVSAGNVRERDPIEIYRDSPMFRALRDVDGFGGRCGRCEYRQVCGGSRARAWAATGDWLAEDPLCVHQPRDDGRVEDSRARASRPQLMVRRLPVV
jgi:radical SAM protein with 4Fe4S-binding SPASM domain